MNGKPLIPKILALVEVFVLAILAVPLITLGVYRLFPAFETWQTEEAGFAFPVFVDVVMVGVCVAAILVRRKRLADYGLTFNNVKGQLDIFAACFLPVVFAGFPLAMVDFKTWGGAFFMAAIQMVLLFALGWLLRKKPAPAAVGVTVMGALVMAAPLQVDSLLPRAVPLFLTYALFVGFGEETIYRGYVHSRLNEVFDRPYQFFGVAVGWGMVFSALVFGLSHSGILSFLMGRSAQVTLAWAFWTAFGGLVFSFVREKSGGILAPALLHGLPQAIAVVAMLFLGGG